MAQAAVSQSAFSEQVSTSKRKIAYIMSRFPNLSETFILREMIGLERLGWSVALHPLIFQRQAVTHQDAQPWIQRARTASFLSAAVLAENARQWLRHPLKMAKLWRRALWENRSSPNYLLRALAVVPQAVYLARLVLQEGAVHVHAHYASHPALAAWVIHQLTGVPYSITVHAHDIYVRKAMLASKVREAEFIVAISAFNRQYLAKTVGEWSREKTYVIHCGIEGQRYDLQRAAGERIAAADARRKNQSGQCFELLSIGSLQPYKGQKYLIEACDLLRQRGLPFHCRIVGAGELSVDLQRQIERLGLEATVELVGPLPQEQVAELLPTVDCYVQPSIITSSGKMEGIPVALMEALACELPVIATQISGIPELVQPGETGYLVPQQDVAALADAIQYVYEHPEQSAALGWAGRSLVLNQFEISKNVQQLADLLQHKILPS